ncbi:MAG TPA: hypothetical protein VN622_12435 [Clostridia bacterium]|nr:hypothetical protein [Clostridia bacterium]
MNAEQPRDPDQIADRQRLVSDIFHTLSQPLTSLHCSLELALRKRMSSAEYRDALQIALDLTEEVMQSAVFVRQLVEAEDPGTTVAINLNAVMTELLQDFEPIAESQHVRVRADLAGELWFRGDLERMRRAFFCLLDSVLHDCRRGSSPLVSSRDEQGCIVLRILADGDERRSIAAVAGDRCFQLAARMVSAIGGSLESQRQGGSTMLTLRLPRLENCDESVSARCQPGFSK